VPRRSTEKAKIMTFETQFVPNRSRCVADVDAAARTARGGGKERVRLRGQRSGLGVLIVALLLGAPSLTACGARSSEMNSTNTGNPPVVEEGKIRVEASGDGVVVRGSVGSVPGGSDVTVTNAATGDDGSTSASDNGSFQVSLPGSTSDDFVVEVSKAGKTTSVTLPGRAPQGDGGPGPVDGTRDDPASYECITETQTEVTVGAAANGVQPACSYLNAEAVCQARRAEQAVRGQNDESCQQDADCMFAAVRPSCADSCGLGPSVNRDTADEFQTYQDQIDASICRDFDELGCVFFASGCPSSGAAEAACIDGFCSTLTGCQLGEHQASRLLEEREVELASGCNTDDDCRAELVGPCVWNCPSRAVHVAAPKESAYASLRVELQETCEAVNFDCDALTCSPLPVPASACVDGMCVADSSAGLRADIEAEIERLNHCQVVEDCEAVRYPVCGTSYVHEDEDTSLLDAWLEEYREANDSPCTGECQCGYLECIDNRCTTSSGDCVSTREGAVNICL